MKPETLDHPELAAWLAANREQDLRPFLADWLRDRDEWEAAEAVMNCRTADEVQAVVLSARLAHVWDGLRPAVEAVTRGAVEAMRAAAHALAPVVAAVNESFRQLGPVLEEHQRLAADGHRAEPGDKTG